MARDNSKPSRDIFSVEYQFDGQIYPTINGDNIISDKLGILESMPTFIFEHVERSALLIDKYRFINSPNTLFGIDNDGKKRQLPVTESDSISINTETNFDSLKSLSVRPLFADSATYDPDIINFGLGTEGLSNGINVSDWNNNEMGVIREDGTLTINTDCYAHSYDSGEAILFGQGSYVEEDAVNFGLASQDMTDSAIIAGRYNNAMEVMNKDGTLTIPTDIHAADYDSGEATLLGARSYMGEDTINFKVRTEGLSGGINAADWNNNEMGVIKEDGTLTINTDCYAHSYDSGEAILFGQGSYVEEDTINFGLGSQDLPDGATIAGGYNNAMGVVNEDGSLTIPTDIHAAGYDSGKATLLGTTSYMEGDEDLLINEKGIFTVEKNRISSLDTNLWNEKTHYAFQFQEEDISNKEILGKIEKKFSQISNEYIISQEGDSISGICRTENDKEVHIHFTNIKIVFQEAIHGNNHHFGDKKYIKN